MVMVVAFPLFAQDSTAESCAPASSRTLDLVFADPLADSEDVAVRMADVHRARIPRHVRRRPGDLEALFDAVPVHRVDVVHPHEQPHAGVRGFASVAAECHRGVAPAAAALAALAEKDL